MWQHVQLSEHIRSIDALACCWDVKQPTDDKYPTLVLKAGSLKIVD